MVRTSASGDELELVALCVVFEKGILRGRLTIYQHISDGGHCLGRTFWDRHRDVQVPQSLELQVKRSLRLFVI
jgi:hypothetical protein